VRGADRQPSILSTTLRSLSAVSAAAAIAGASILEAGRDIEYQPLIAPGIGEMTVSHASPCCMANASLNHCDTGYSRTKVVLLVATQTLKSL
jgi:hypothetical protein